MKLTLLLAAALAGLLSFAGAARAQGTQPAAKPAESPGGQPAATQPAPPTEKTVYVLMKTSMGDLAIELNHEKAPISVDNFLAYADKKYYDGTVFHRVIPDFMIQGGAFTPDLAQKATDKPIKNEWQNGLKNTRGTLAMARIGGKADSATSQFFINVKDNAFLDENRDKAAGYAVFAKVVDGMEVVDKIKGVRTGVKSTPQGPMNDVPLETVTITEVRRMTPKEVEALKAKLGEKK